MNNTICTMYLKKVAKFIDLAGLRLRSGASSLVEM